MVLFFSDMNSKELRHNLHRLLTEEGHDLESALNGEGGFFSQEKQLRRMLVMLRQQAGAMLPSESLLRIEGKTVVAECLFLKKNLQVVQNILLSYLDKIQGWKKSESVFFEVPDNDEWLRLYLEFEHKPEKRRRKTE